MIEQKNTISATRAEAVKTVLEAHSGKANKTVGKALDLEQR